MSAEHALSPREEWLLLLWMSKHPRAVWEDTTLGQPSPAPPRRRAPVAYAVGVAVGTLWLLVRRWW